MKVISKHPKQSKIIQLLNRLPALAQLLLIAILLFTAWQFRYYTTGVDEAQLTKVEGTLYSFECESRLRGADEIILSTSLDARRIWFRGWQKCKNLSEIMPYASSSQEVVFYTQRTRGIFSMLRKNNGILRVYAVDLKSPKKQLIYPVNGLGERANPNVFAILLVCLVFPLLNSLRKKWRAKQSLKKTRSK